jgi:hypothetical protein
MLSTSYVFNRLIAESRPGGDEDEPVLEGTGDWRPEQHRREGPGKEVTSSEGDRSDTAKRRRS